MIKQINNLPTGTVGFTAHGNVTADDYENVVYPVLLKTFADHPVLNMVYVIDDDVEKYSFGAIMKDAKIGLNAGPTHWGRVAIATNLDWVKHTVHAFTSLLPMDVKFFTPDQKQAAIDWAVDAPTPVSPAAKEDASKDKSSKHDSSTAGSSNAASSKQASASSSGAHAASASSSGSGSSAAAASSHSGDDTSSSSSGSNS